MKHKLSCIRKPWRRLAIAVTVKLLMTLNVFLVPLGGRRAHWVGKPPRSRWDIPVIGLLFVGAMLLLEPREYATWAALWGGSVAIIVNLCTAYRLLPRRRAHWIR